MILIAVCFGLPATALAQSFTFDTPAWLPLESVTANDALTNYVSAPDTVPTEHISPEDIAQDSIQMLRIWTNSFVVRWTYTEAGAEKMVAFEEAHEGKKVRVVIGDFQRLITLSEFRPMPPVFTNRAQWKEGWLKRRTTKFYSLSEDEAKLLMAGLKKQMIENS